MFAQVTAEVVRVLKKTQLVQVKPVPDVDILFTIVTVYLSVFSLILVVYQFLVK